MCAACVERALAWLCSMDAQHATAEQDAGSLIGEAGAKNVQIVDQGRIIFSHHACNAKHCMTEKPLCRRATKPAEMSFCSYYTARGRNSIAVVSYRICACDKKKRVAYSTQRPRSSAESQSRLQAMQETANV